MSVYYISWYAGRWSILSQKEAMLTICGGGIVHRVTSSSQTIPSVHPNGGPHSYYVDHFVAPIESISQLADGDLSARFSARMGHFICIPPRESLIGSSKAGCEIRYLSVHPAFRGISLARYLIGQVHQKAWEAKIPQVSTVLYGRCEEMYSFFDHMGYRMVTGQTAPYTGYSDRWVHMVKKLP